MLEKRVFRSRANRRLVQLVGITHAMSKFFVELKAPQIDTSHVCVLHN